MATSAGLMPSSSPAANSDLALQSPIYPIDPAPSTSKSPGSAMMDDFMRNMYEPAEGGGAGGKTFEEAWKEISGRKMDGAGDGSGSNGGVTLEQYLIKEAMRVPAEYAVDPAVMSQQHGQMVGEGQNQALGFGNGAESGGRGRGRKRSALDPVDRAALQRQKRMIKNRESAARSRERKQAYTVELESLVTQLEEENARLLREQEELHRQRLKQLMENIIPVAEQKKPSQPLALQRTWSWPWVRGEPKGLAPLDCLSQGGITDQK